MKIDAVIRDEFSEFDSDAFFTNPKVKTVLEQRCCKRTKRARFPIKTGMTNEQLTEFLNVAQSKGRLTCLQELNTLLTKEDIIRLCDLTQEPSIVMPEGLTREQRREWAASVASLYNSIHSELEEKT